MRYLIILLFLTGCAAVPKEEKPELQEYVKRGDVIWYCESRGGPKRCGWVNREDVERAIKAIYRW
jgi:hypothetical protein